MKSFNKFVFLLLIMFAALGSCTQTPSTTVKITDLSTLIQKATSDQTIDLTQYGDITNFTATIDKKLTIKGSVVRTDLKSATITVKVPGVVLRNVSNVNVVIDESVGSGGFSATDSSFNELTVSGGGIVSNHILLSNTTVKECTIDKKVDNNADSPEYLGIELDGSCVINKVTLNNTSVAFHSKDNSEDQIKELIFKADSDYAVNLAYGLNISVHSGTSGCVARYSDSTFADSTVPVGFNICVEKGKQSSKVSKNFFKQACRFILGNVNSGTINDDSTNFNRIIENDCTVDIKNMADAITISFDGGSDATGDMSPIRAVLDGYFIVPGCAFTYQSHKFEAWTVSDDETVRYEAGSSAKFSKSTLLKARWLDAYTITYIDMDTTFDSWNTKYTPTVVFTAQDNVILPAKNDVNKAGYKLIGWYDNKQFSGKMYSEIKADSVKKNLTLYAKWEYDVKVSNLRIRNGNKRLQLRWTNPTNSSFDHVIIKCNDMAPREISGTSGQDMSCDFTGLDNGTQYFFSVKCCDVNNIESKDVTADQHCGNYFADNGNIVIKGEEIPKSKLVTVTDVTADITGSGEEGAFPEGRNVKLSPYGIGAYLVTQKLYDAVTDKNPSSNTEDEMLPVECVTFEDAVSFLDKLSGLFGFDMFYESIFDETSDLSSDSYSYEGFRLASEAEWEFAARGADTDSPLWNMKYSGSDDADLVAWYNSEGSDKKTHPVGELKPISDKLPIYDMCGNVWEWCCDIYTAELPTGNFIDPLNIEGKKLVLRGGSFINEDVNVKIRSSEFITRSNKMLGFRIARSLN